MNYKRIIIIISFFSLFFIPQYLFAAPIISSASGVLQNGNPITIQGIQFGTKPAAAPLISSYNNSTSAANWSTGSYGGAWTTSGAVSLSNSPPLRTAFSQSSYKTRYGTTGGYATVRYLYSSAPRHIYVSFWMYRDYSTWSINAGTGSNNKFLRIYENVSGAGGDIFSSLIADSNGNAQSLSINAESDLHTPTITATYMNAFFYSSAWYDVRTSAANANMRLQAWEHYEYDLLYPSTPGGYDGIGIVWKDGKLHSRTINVPMNYASGTQNVKWFVFGLVSGSRTTAGSEYIDQIYIDSTPARVFISNRSDVVMNNPNWAHNEIQVPSSWSDTSITFTLNQGTFNVGDTVYLYVVDPTGAISNPTSLLIGSTIGGASPRPISSPPVSGITPPN